VPPSSGPCGQLRYPGFSVVWFDVFSLPEKASLPEHDGSLLQPLQDDLDPQIFDPRFLDREAMKRFTVDGWNMTVVVDQHPHSPVISGEVRVRVTRYFDETICVSYRLIASTNKKDAERFGFGTTTGPLATDHLILLVGMGSGVEHWHVEADGADNAETYSIHRDVRSCTVSGLVLNANGQRQAPAQLVGRNDVMHEVRARYRRFLLGNAKNESVFSTGYCLIDIWESVSHSAPISFKTMDSGGVVEHINEHHRAELMGLLTLYPYEWPYRDARFYRRVCGENIAIDTDDLVLVTHNAALVLGTYGKRGAGSPTDWQKILETRRDQHVSWGEYLRILEIVLAKLHTINRAAGGLQPIRIENRLSGENEQQIKKNSLFALRVSQMIVDMNAVTFSRYVSHKVMYDETERRLGVEADLNTLTISLAQIDKAMQNLDGIEQARRARRLNVLLLAISIASLFQIIFQPLAIPLVTKLLKDQVMAEEVGSYIISFFTLLLFLYPPIALLYLGTRSVIRWVQRRVSKKQRR
jgi:hypothetical protein